MKLMSLITINETSGLLNQDTGEQYSKFLRL